MLNYFKKETKWIEGTLYMKADDLGKFVCDLIFIATVLNIDAERFIAEFQENALYGKAYRINVVVPNSSWNILKKAGRENKITINGTSEKVLNNKNKKVEAVLT